jgi:hypothetical protein
LILLKPSWDNIKIHMINPENLTKVWVDALENENLSAHDPKQWTQRKFTANPSIVQQKIQHCSKMSTVR